VKRFSKGKVIITAAVLCISLSGCNLIKNSGTSTTTAKQPVASEQIGNADNVDTTDYIGNIAESTLIFNQDGSILEIAVEDFGSVAYNSGDLKSYIKSSVQSYNEAAGEDRVTLKQYIDQSGIAKTAILFDSVESYNDFNNTTIENGLYNMDDANEIAESEEAATETSEEATSELSDEELAELGLEKSDLEEGGVAENTGGAQENFVDKDGNSVTADAISDEYFMIIIDEDIVVSFDGGEVKYVNKHATIVDGTHVKSNGTGTAVIVYSK